MSKVYQFYYASISDQLLFITNVERTFLGSSNLISMVFASNNLTLGTDSIQVVNLCAPANIFLWLEVRPGVEVTMFDLVTGAPISTPLVGLAPIQKVAFANENQRVAITFKATTILGPGTYLGGFGFSRIITSINEVFKNGLELISSLPPSIQLSTLDDGSKILNFLNVPLVQNQYFEMFKGEVAQLPGSYFIQSSNTDVFDNVTNSYTVNESIIMNLKAKKTTIFSGTILFSLTQLNNEIGLNALYGNYDPISE